jgi:hypothetical protein
MKRSTFEHKFFVRPYTVIEQLIYLIYLKQKQEGISVMDNQEDSQPEDTANAVKTIFVSDIKDSTTEDSITLFFENRKRSGGGDLCEGKEKYKRLSATVARLTFISSKGNSVSISLVSSSISHSP